MFFLYLSATLAMIGNGSEWKETIDIVGYSLDFLFWRHNVMNFITWVAPITNASTESVSAKNSNKCLNILFMQNFLIHFQ